MLNLRRKKGQSIVIGGVHWITVAEVIGDNVVLSVDSPREVDVDREEVWARKMAERRNGNCTRLRVRRAA